jgi:ATP-dependent 26S proteasome regulatory subunit
LQVHTRNTPLSKNVGIDFISNQTDGFSGAELKSLVVEAAMNAISDNRSVVSKIDIVKSIEIITKKKNESPINSTENLYR